MTSIIESIDLGDASGLLRALIGPTAPPSASLVSTPAHNLLNYLFFSMLQTAVLSDTLVEAVISANIQPLLRRSFGEYGFSLFLGI